MNSKQYLLKASKGEILESLGISLIILIIFCTFFRLTIVNGSSMEPTLNNGDVVLVSRLSNIEKNDIVIAMSDDRYVIKRVAGVSGDSINGYTLSDGEFYILGDNANHSYDSRNYGPVNKLYGKAFLRLLPIPKLL